MLLRPLSATSYVPRLRDTSYLFLRKGTKRFTSGIVNFLNEDDGPAAVEYAVKLALIVVVCLTTITSVGTVASAKFVEVTTAISN